MNRIEVHLWVAAVLQWLVASSNLFAARIFAYREELAKLSLFVREVFIVQNIYIMTTVAMFGIVSIVFTPELAGGSALGRFLSDFLGWPDHHPALLLRSRGQTQPADREPRVPGHLHLPLWCFRRGLPTSQSMKRGALMPIPIPWHGLLVGAGAAQLILVVASLAIPHFLNWKGDLAKLRPLNRQVFWTYAAYIWVTNLSFGLVSTMTPQLLLDRSPLAGFVCSFIAVYWAARVVIQFGYFDRTDAPKGRFFVLGERALVTLFVGLTIVYGGLVARALGALGR